MLEHLNEILDSTQITTSTAAVRLAISFVLGAIIGAERQFRRRDAGMRTFTLICMGSAAAMLISIWIPQTYPNFLNGDPGRIAAQVLTGIGFLGAGAIIQSHIQRVVYGASDTRWMSLDKLIHLPDSKSWKRAWTHYGGLYLGNGCSRFGRWCRYVLGRFYHYGIYLVRIGFFRKAGATYVFGWC